MVGTWDKGSLSSSFIWVSNYSFVEWEYDMAALPWQYDLLPYPTVCRLLLGALRTWKQMWRWLTLAPIIKSTLDFSLFIAACIYSLKPRLSELHWCPIFLTKLWLLIFCHLFFHPLFSSAQSVHLQWFPTQLCLRLKSRSSTNGSAFGPSLFLFLRFPVLLPWSNFPLFLACLFSS